MSFSVPTGKPGVQPTTSTTTPRTIFYGQQELAMYLPFPITIDGTLSSNPANAPYNWLLWAGTFLGQVTSSLKFACSIIGNTTLALGGAQTTLQTDVNTAAYLVARVGTSGTFNLTGAPTANAPVANTRTLTVTYSNVNLSTGVVTITATAVGTVSGTNQVNSLVTVDSTGSGTFKLTVEGITTAAITYSATAATLASNANTQLDATFGTSAVVQSGASLAAQIITFSGTGYTHRPVGLVTATLQAGATGFTMNGSGVVGIPSTCPVTTPGVLPGVADEGEFVAGSLIQPTDGSQNIKTIITDQFGTKVIDQLNTTRVDVFAALLWAGGGVIDSSYLVNYPTDTGIRQFIKNQIRGFVGQGLFSDDYIGG